MSQQDGTAHQRRGAFRMTDEEVGKALAAVAGIGLALAVWPGLALAVPVMLAVRALEAPWWSVATGTGLAALPLALGGEQALARYMIAEPAWRVPAALEQLGSWGWIGATLPVALPLAGLAALAVLARDRLRQSPEQALERRERAARRRVGRSRARASAPARARVRGQCQRRRGRRRQASGGVGLKPGAAAADRRQANQCVGPPPLLAKRFRVV